MKIIEEDYGICEEEKDLCEFGIVDEECYFCGQPRTIRFDEHYYFCPNCTALYTFFMIKKTKCKHITKDTPFLLRKPYWHTNMKDKKYIYEDDDGETQRCSECNAECIADGW